MSITSYLLYKSLRPVAKRLSPIIRLWEKKRLDEFGGRPLAYQPTFIIGAPRTGSTIIYQLLTRTLHVTYINNFIDIFFKNLFFGFWLNEFFFSGKKHSSTKSEFGNTKKSGLTAPSECGAFWYQWLPKEKHFIDFNEVSVTDKLAIQRIIQAVINFSDKPLAFKNLNMGQRMRLIKEIFPEAKFIFIKRSPQFVAQSILLAKRKLMIQPDQIWSVKPKNYKTLQSLPEYRQVVHQVYYLEKQIFHDRKLFPPSNFMTIKYDEFLNTPSQWKEIAHFIDSKVSFRKNYRFPNIDIQDKVLIPSNEWKLILNEVEKLDWNNYDS